MTTTKQTSTDPRDMAAYERLSYTLMNLHHSERDALDVSPHYRAILDAVKAEDDELAIDLALTLETEAGESWRARREIPFIR